MSLKGITHVGVTVANLERAIQFYWQTLGLRYEGRMIMEGEETDKLFGLKNCKVHVAYLNGSKELAAPPVELIYFENYKTKENTSDLTRISISEICFEVEDIQHTYKKLQEKGVEFLSEPQFFDLADQGFGKSTAVYFKDSEGNILELIENHEVSVRDVEFLWE